MYFKATTVKITIRDVEESDHAENPEIDLNTWGSTVIAQPTVREGKRAPLGRRVPRFLPSQKHSDKWELKRKPIFFFFSYFAFSRAAPKKRFPG